MADYAAHADVEALLAGRAAFSSTSKPTDAQVDGFCSQITIELNGVLAGAGYATPVTDTDALKPVKLYCCYGAAYLAERARYPERKASEEDPAEEWWERYQNALEMIRAGELAAPLSTASTAGGVGSYWQEHSDDTDAATAWHVREDEF